MAKQTKDEAVQWYAQNRGLYKKLSIKINNILLELLDEADITVHAITNRTKDIDSFKNKIEDLKYDDPINQITDLSGVRIIAYVEDDLKPICKLLEETFYIDPTNSLDKSEELGTDKVGYRSIHYIARIKDERLNLSEYKKFNGLKFEIQIRTILQHAWAEIEHDKNYKFNGILPLEIKRRFKILAGTLELIDKEFNDLSNAIDKISKNVSIAVGENKLNEIEISSTTLKQFLIDNFSVLVNERLIEPNFANADDKIITELSLFGVNKLSELNELIPNDFSVILKEILVPFDPSNFLVILRVIMMIANNRNYFENAWNNSWQMMTTDTQEILKYYKVDVEQLINTYNLDLGY